MDPTDLLRNELDADQVVDCGENRQGSSRRLWAEVDCHKREDEGGRDEARGDGRRGGYATRRRSPETRHRLREQRPAREVFDVQRFVELIPNVHHMVTS